ncbi:alpha/beta fold hydrolase [Catenibacterium sp. GCM10023432]|uniref:alpha/beta fold hydrolase n=1 Tax=Catenibacterium sp. GCM10023432 TaxID=3252638 RepID=UPI003617222C
MWSYIVGGVFLALAIYFLVQGIRCGAAVRESKNRLAAYNAQTVALSYGEITYVDSGEGEVILSVHGIFGGYDQAYDTCKDFCSDYRIIAPSRFGYLGSDVSGDGTPARQAAAYVELLDKLGIDKVYLLATSAGGSVAIRFALDYPQRAKGLILYCSAMPPVEKPEKYAEYAGPPPFLCNDYIMFLLSPMFEPIMGMEPSTIYSMLPINDRKVGVILDASVTNPDMARDFGEYPIEDLQVPTLIFHAKDDKLASYIETGKAVSRFPNCTFISFESGGHLLTGHVEEIKETVSCFVEDSSH